MRTVLIITCLFISAFANAQTPNCDQYRNMAKTSPDREAIKYYSIIINSCHDSSALFNIGTRYATIAQTLKPADIGIRSLNNKNTIIFQNAIRDTLFKGLAYINKSFRYISDTVPLLTDRSQVEALVAQLTYTADADRFNHYTWISKSERDIAVRDSLNKIATLRQIANRFNPTLQKDRSIDLKVQPADTCKQYWNRAKNINTGNNKKNLQEQIKYYSLIIRECHDSSAYLEKGDCYLNLAGELTPFDVGLKPDPYSNQISGTLFDKIIEDTLLQGLACINKSFRYYTDTITLLSYRAKAEELIAKLHSFPTNEDRAIYNDWMIKSSYDLNLYTNLQELYPSKGTPSATDSLNGWGISWHLPDSAGYLLYGYKLEYYIQNKKTKGNGANGLILGYKEYWISSVNTFLNRNDYKVSHSQYSHFYPDKTKANPTSSYAIWQWNEVDGNGMKTGNYIKGTFLIDKNDRTKSAVFTGTTDNLVWFFLNYLQTAEFNVIASDGAYLEEKRGLTVSKAAYELRGKKATETNERENFVIDFTAPDKQVKVSFIRNNH